MIVKDSDLLAFNEIIKKVFKLLDDEDFAELSNYETDELLNRQIMEMEVYKNLGQRLHYDKVICYPTSYTDIENYYDGEKYVINMKVSYERYVTDAAGEVVDGIRDYIMESKYKVSIIRNPNFHQDGDVCDFCGAPIEINENRCQYCGSMKTKKKSEWIVTDMNEIKVQDLESKMRFEKQKNNSKEWKDLISSLNRNRKSF